MFVTLRQRNSLFDFLFVCLATNVQPVATAAPINPPQPTFVPSASTNPPSAPTPTSIQLQSPNRLPAGSTILLAAPQESPIRVGLPVQMMPHGAQIIQVQSHPHGQPVQVVQRFPGSFVHRFSFFIQTNDLFSHRSCSS